MKKEEAVKTEQMERLEELGRELSEGLALVTVLREYIEARLPDDLRTSYPVLVTLNAIAGRVRKALGMIDAVPDYGWEDGEEEE